MKEETKQLWELCFHDDKEFTELYFQKRYKEERNRVIYENGRLIAALQVIPYPLRYGSRILSSEYISGACTHPSFRSQGVMKQLLEETHRKMYQDNIKASILIPAGESLFGYYEKAGYAPVFNYELQSVHMDGPEMNHEFKIETYTPYQLDVPAYLNRKMQQRRCCILHTEEDFKVILADLSLNKGELSIARLNGEIVGAAIYVPQKGFLYVKELLYENEEVKTALLQEAARKTRIQELIYLTPSTGTTGKKLGMARVIRAEEMIRIWAEIHSGQTLAFELIDDDIPQNNGFYHLEQGNIRKFQTPQTQNYHLFTIRELTEWLFKDQHPYMSLMLND